MTSHILDLQLWSLLGGVVVPLLVAFLAKATAPSWLKAILNLGLSALTGAIVTVLNNNGNVGNWVAWVSSWAITWWTSIVSYYGLHTQVGSTKAVSAKSARFGIG